MATKKTQEVTINITPVERGHVEFCVVGTTGLLHNRLQEKAQRQLLMPTAAEFKDRKKQGLAKHNIDEYPKSPYVSHDPKSPTLIEGLGSWFRGAMAAAALEIPGAKKTQTQRLVWVEDDRVPIYGKQYLDCSIVRMADMNKTPDVRLRAYQPEWAAVVRVSFVSPQFSAEGITNLLAAAGTFIGVGDGRKSPHPPEIRQSRRGSRVGLLT